MPVAETIDCMTHLMLKDRMRADLRVYKDAIEVMERATGSGFEKAQQLAEIARISFQAARERFNAHVSSHKCEVRYVRYGPQKPVQSNPC